MCGDEKLRAMLYDLTENSEFLTTYNFRWAEIGKYTAHGIRDISGPGYWNYNCFAYALGLNGNPQFDRLVAAHGGHPEPLVPGRFIEHLKKKGILSVRSGSNYSPQDIVLYYGGKKLKHAARVVTTIDKLESKWGVGRHYQHGLYEVPYTYGDTIEVARAPDVATVLKELARWQSSGRK